MPFRVVVYRAQGRSGNLLLDAAQDRDEAERKNIRDLMKEVGGAGSEESGKGRRISIKGEKFSSDSGWELCLRNQFKTAT
jgi:hypothetical protein